MTVLSAHANRMLIGCIQSDVVPNSRLTGLATIAVTKAVNAALGKLRSVISAVVKV